MSKEAFFSQVYQEYFDRIYNFIYSRTHSQDDAEDIVQETFSGIWKSIDNFDQEKPIGSYLYQIAKNKLNDYLKRKYRINAFSAFFSLDNTSEEELDNYADKTEDKGYLTKAHSKALKLIEQLEANYKKVLELRYVKGYKISEVAKELGLSENNVKVIQNRAIKKLKELINSK